LRRSGVLEAWNDLAILAKSVVLVYRVCVVREGFGLRFGVKIVNFQKFEESAGEA
jgi:hypothetical protein